MAQHIIDITIINGISFWVMMAAILCCKRIEMLLLATNLNIFDFIY